MCMPGSTLWRYTRPLWFKNARNLPNEHHCKTYRSSIASMVINRSIGEGARESDQAWISLARGSLMCPSSCYDRTWDRQRGKTIGPRVRSDAKHSVILKINRSMSGNRGLCETLVGGKIRVGQVTGNKHFFFWPYLYKYWTVFSCVNTENIFFIRTIL